MASLSFMMSSKLLCMFCKEKIFLSLNPYITVLVYFYGNKIIRDASIQH
jgi:hypothetical protein